MSPTVDFNLRQTGDSGARAFTWAIWAVMLAIALYFFATTTNPLPLTEDWQLVPAITGNEPHLLDWLWSQNNEHRVPLPRLLLYGVLKAAHGNFRAPMLLNIALPAMLAALLMMAARNVRGGMARYTDAVFPILLLNAGHWENFYWAWQLTFVLCVFLAGVILVVLLTDPDLRKRSSAWAMSAALVAEPLSGGTGLLFVPLLALWTGYRGLRDLRRNGRRGNGLVLMAGAVISLGLCVIYFVGYQRPEWTVQETSLLERLGAIFKVLTLGFGPATRTLWAIFIPYSLVLLSWTGWVVVRVIRERRRDDRARLIGLAAFFATLLFYAAALGWGRAGVVRVVYHVWPTRYMLLMVPLLCVVYLLWEVCGSARERAIMQAAVFVPAILLVPANTAHGRIDSVFLAERWEKVMADLDLPIPDFAQRHHADLDHAETVEELSAQIRMLKDAGRWPLTRLQDKVPEDDLGTAPGGFVRKRVRYHVPGATEASLVWGVNGWKSPAGKPPEGTQRESGLMRTVMRRTGDGEFEAAISVPRNVSFQFGFRVRDSIRHPEIDPLWEGSESFHAFSNAEADILDVHSGLRFDADGAFAVTTAPTVSRTFRYRSPDAREVWLIWGVHGWFPEPPNLRPPHTRISEGRTQTLMSRRGDEFEAVLQAPADSRVNCGFLITERRGIFSMLGGVWDAACHDTGGSVIDSRAQVSLDSVQPYLPRFRGYFVPISAAALLWVLLWRVFEFLGGRVDAGLQQVRGRERIERTRY